jgi:hypothetical protein
MFSPTIIQIIVSIVSCQSRKVISTPSITVILTLNPSITVILCGAKNPQDRLREGEESDCSAVILSEAKDLMALRAGSGRNLRFFSREDSFKITEYR